MNGPRSRRLWAAALLALAAGGIVGCGGTTTNDAGDLTPSDEPLRPRALRDSFESLHQLASHSTKIAIGTVEGVASSTVELPPDASSPAVRFRVEEILKGEAETGTEVVVRFVRLTGYPGLEEGNRYLLFLDDFWIDPVTKAPTGEFAVVGVWAGMYGQTAESQGSGAEAQFKKPDPESALLPEVLTADDITEPSAAK